MPKKYQNGKLEVREEVARPYYFVRASVVRIDKPTGQRRRIRQEHKLGFIDEISRKRAMELCADVLETINAGRFIAQSQIRCKDLVKRFVDIRWASSGWRPKGSTGVKSTTTYCQRSASSGYMISTSPP